MPSMMTATALAYRLAFSAAPAFFPCAARMLRGVGQIRFFLVYPLQPILYVKARASLGGIFVMPGHLLDLRVLVF